MTAHLSSPDEINAFRDTLLPWYRANSRPLPWRDTEDPYAIWVSEIMLQQTRVETVIGYFDRWMTSFPNLAALAQASEEDVMRHWQGLGYYRRARFLHRGARYVVDELNGTIPDRADALRKLPGVGPYTAGAIASIAFGQPEPAIDGNVFRVTSRIFDDESDISRGPTRALFEALVRPLIPPAEAGDFCQAMIELGATICKPTNPDCIACPIQHSCAAYHAGTVLERPVKKGKTKVREERRAARVRLATFGSSGPRVLVARRCPNGLLGGLWEFPLCAQDDHEAPHVAGIVSHRFSHIAMTIGVSIHLDDEHMSQSDALANAATVLREERYDTYRYVSATELAQLPVSTMMSKMLRIASDTPTWSTFR